MKILNFGSLNIDYVYQVDHMTREGETQQSLQLETFPGGKGLNQSIALAKAGMQVYHAGLIGEDGDLLLDTCKKSNVDTTFIKRIGSKSGQAVIQVDKNAQNCILVHKGANGEVTKEYVDTVLQNFVEGDMIILQNEINMIDYIMDRAYEKSMIIVLNPSPLDDKLFACDLEKVSVFIMNEVEGSAIAKGKENPQEILDFMMEKYPSSKVVLTLGEDGAYYRDKERQVYQPIFKTTAVDTTAAGDTFTGYFIRGMAGNDPMDRVLEMASCASAIAVSRKGAAVSIPLLEEVEKYMKEHGKK